MARIEREARIFGSNSFVFGSRHLDPLDTACLPALADQLEQCILVPAEMLGKPFEAFVDLTEDCLVQTEALRTEIYSTSCSSVAREPTGHGWTPPALDVLKIHDGAVTAFRGETALAVDLGG